MADDNSEGIGRAGTIPVKPDNAFYHDVKDGNVSGGPDRGGPDGV